MSLLTRPVEAPAEAVAELAGSRVLIYCGGSSWDAPPGTDRHLASHLAEHLPVVYVDPPESLAWQLRQGRRPTLRAEFAALDDQLYRLRPRAFPGSTRPVLRHAARWASRRAMADLVGALDLVVAAQVVTTMDDLFGAVPAERRVLYGTDDFVAGAHLMHVSRAWVESREPRQLAAATQAFAVSEVLAERWRLTGHPVSVLPNGCDAEAFADTSTVEPSPAVTVPGPRAIVVGQLSERLDFALLEAVADTGVSLVLVGPALGADAERRLRALSNRPRVQWVGRQPFAALPSLLRTASVGLTPYVDEPFNRASFPLKTLEYLSAGLPVVSTDLPAARALGTVHVRVAARDRFVAETLAQLARPWSADDAVERQRLAAQHSWAARARTLVAQLGIET